MAEENPKNVQDIFLNHLCKSKISLMVFLVNGIKLEGILIKFDIDSLLLSRDNQYQLIYKHAISSIMPKIDFQAIDNKQIY